MKTLLAACAAFALLLLPGLAIAAATPQLPLVEQLAVPSPIVAEPQADACMFFVLEDADRCVLALASAASCPPEVPRRLLTLPLEMFASADWLISCRVNSAGGAPPG